MKVRLKRQKEVPRSKDVVESVAGKKEELERLSRMEELQKYQRISRIKMRQLTRG